MSKFSLFLNQVLNYQRVSNRYKTLDIYICNIVENYENPNADPHMIIDVNHPEQYYTRKKFCPGWPAWTWDVSGFSMLKCNLASAGDIQAKDHQFRRLFVGYFSLGRDHIYKL